MRDYTTKNPSFSDTISVVEECDLINAQNDTAAAKQLLANTLMNAAAVRTEAERAAAAEALKAPIDSPTFTGTPKAPTPETSANDLRIATTAFVKAVINALIGGAPEALDTLKEIADAIAEHKDVTDAITAAIGKKVDKVEGKGLSTNDYTTIEKNKLSDVAETLSKPLPISKGGTGKTTAAEGFKALLDGVQTGSTVPTDDDWYLCQWANGTAEKNETPIKRSMLALWNYIKSKFVPPCEKTIDNNFLTKFRTQTKGDANGGAYISAIRNNTADVDGAPQWGSGLAFGVTDTHGYLFTDYTTPKAFIGGGNADVLKWVKELAFKDSTYPEFFVKTATNFDTIKTTGIYHMQIAGCTGLPTENWGTVIVEWSTGTNYQIFIPDGSVRNIYKRGHKGNNWENWKIINPEYTAGAQLMLEGTVFKLKNICDDKFTDWNDVTKNGWYMSNSAAHAPGTGWFYGIAIVHLPTYVRQIVYAFSGDNNVTGTKNDRYERICRQGTWGEWVNTTVRKAVPANAVFTDKTVGCDIITVIAPTNKTLDEYIRSMPDKTVAIVHYPVTVFSDGQEICTRYGFSQYCTFIIEYYDKYAISVLINNKDKIGAANGNTDISFADSIKVYSPANIVTNGAVIEAYKKDNTHGPRIKINGSFELREAHTNNNNYVHIEFGQPDRNIDQILHFPFEFGVDASGNYGYKRIGADTVTPFLSPINANYNVNANVSIMPSNALSGSIYFKFITLSSYNVIICPINNLHYIRYHRKESSTSSTYNNGYKSVTKVVNGSYPSTIKKELYDFSEKLAKFLGWYMYYINDEITLCYSLEAGRGDNPGAGSKYSPFLIASYTSELGECFYTM